MTPFRDGTPSSSQEVMRTHGRSFHFASHFLKDRHAERAARLYAFCRYLDDTVDLAESKSEAERTLDHIARELAGEVPATAAASTASASTVSAAAKSPRMMCPAPSP